MKEELKQPMKAEIEAKQEAIEICQKLVDGMRKQVAELHYTDDEKRAWRSKIAALSLLIKHAEADKLGFVLSIFTLAAAAGILAASIWS